MWEQAWLGMHGRTKSLHVYVHYPLFPHGAGRRSRHHGTALRGGNSARHGPGHSQRPAQSPGTGWATSARRPRVHTAAAVGARASQPLPGEPDRHLALPSTLRKSLLVLRASGTGQDPDSSSSLALPSSQEISFPCQQTAQKQRGMDASSRPLNVHKPAHLRKIRDQKLARHWEAEAYLNRDRPGKPNGVLGGEEIRNSPPTTTPAWCL